MRKGPSIVLAFIVAISAPKAVSQDFDIGGVAKVVAEEVAVNLDDAARANLLAAAEAEPTSEGAEGLAIAMLVNRHLVESAYFYALAVERDPSNAALMTSLGAIAREMSAAGQPLTAIGPAELVALQRTALMLEPDDPSIKHNLATALRALGTPEALAEARALLEAAVAADPDNGLFGARLADVLMDLGLEDLAREALNRAFALEPVSVPIAVANAKYFGGEAIGRSPEMCKVDFRCDEVCPGGIIGRINFVTCEMENASALNACRAGQPFPVAFNCQAQMPKFGILIPGLDPGFSILTPWGSIDILVQGDGTIEAKIRINGPALAGPLKSLVAIEGSYDPASGEIRIQSAEGVSIGIPATNNAAADLLKDLGFGPSIRILYNNSPDEGEPNIEPTIGIFRGKVIG